MLRIYHDDTASIQFEQALLIEPNAFRKGDLLFFKYAVGECVGGVIFGDGAGALQDDGAVVVGLIDEVDGASADFAAVVDDGLMHLEAIHSLAAKAG